MIDLARIDPASIGNLSDEEFKKLAASILALNRQERQENQILYYKPVSDRARQMHLSPAKLRFVGGGNRASKTDSAFAEIVARATGRMPLDPELGPLFKSRFRGPIRVRVVIESIKNTLYGAILPKLKWFAWNGLPPAGGEKGHWGWIPKDCLINGSWEKSWNNNLSTLTFKCFDPDDNYHLGESTIQFMSHSQDPSDFASGEFHIIHLDEPPKELVFTESQARVMSVAGDIFLTMTWPDNPTVPVEWIFERILDKKDEDPEIDCFELYTTENQALDQVSVTRQMEQWSKVEQQVRIYGRPLRFSNLIHPDFTDRPMWWCFKCKEQTLPPENDCCVMCKERTAVQYNHVRDFVVNPAWPVVHAMDPHPRKPHMWLWVAVDPFDDLWVVAEDECAGELPDVTEAVHRVERELRLRTVRRIMDPNMGATEMSIQHRGITVQEEFRNAGLTFDLGNDSAVGRMRVNEFLKPDPAREAPRLHVHPRCVNLIRQMKRYAWDEYSKALEKDVKQTPKAKHDDGPTLLKYVMNSNPEWHRLQYAGEVIYAGGGRGHGRRRY